MRGLLTVTEAAERLGLSPGRVRVLIRSGRLRAERLGSTYVLEQREVARFAKLPRKPGRPWS